MESAKRSRNPKAILSDRWHKALHVYEQSRINAELKTRVLRKMPSEVYQLWENLNLEALLANLDKISMEMKTSYVILLWFSEESENLREGLLCPELSSRDSKVSIFKECK